MDPDYLRTRQSVLGLLYCDNDSVYSHISLNDFSCNKISSVERLPSLPLLPLHQLLLYRLVLLDRAYLRLLQLLPDPSDLLSLQSCSPQLSLLYH